MHVYSYTRYSKDAGEVTVLLCVNSDGSDKRADCYRKISETAMVQE
jgi:hypothetical protein